MTKTSYTTSVPVGDFLNGRRTEARSDVPREEPAPDLGRVRVLIESHVIAFCRMCLEFTGSELETYVQSQVASTPGSAMRVLRALRTQGIIQYEVVNRHASLYRVRRVIR